MSPSLLQVPYYVVAFNGGWFWLATTREGHDAIVREVRVELTRPCGHQILSLARLPFRHSRKDHWPKDRAEGLYIFEHMCDTRIRTSVQKAR